MDFRIPWWLPELRMRRPRQRQLGRYFQLGLDKVASVKPTDVGDKDWNLELCKLLRDSNVASILGLPAGR